MIDISNKIHQTAILDKGVKIGKNCKVWHWTHISGGAIIGNSCSFGQNVFIGNNVLIGNNVKIQNNVSVYTGVICEDDVFLGPSMVFTNVINPRSKISRRSEFKKTLVKEGSTIGANATIICGITIGKFSFIGAGAVVTKDVLDYSLVVGNPSKHIGWISEYGHRLEFNLDGIAVCEESQQQYKLINNKVLKIN